MIRTGDGVVLRNDALLIAGQIRIPVVGVVCGLLLILAGSAQAQGELSSPAALPEIVLQPSTSTLPLSSRDQTVVFRLVTLTRNIRDKLSYRIVAVDYDTTVMELRLTASLINGKWATGQPLLGSGPVGGEPLTFSRELEFELKSHASLPEKLKPLRFTYRPVDGTTTDLVTTIQLQVMSSATTEGETPRVDTKSSTHVTTAEETRPARNGAPSPHTPPTTPSSPASPALLWIVAICVAVLAIDRVIVLIKYYRPDSNLWPRSGNRSPSQGEGHRAQIQGPTTPSVDPTTSNRPPPWFNPLLDEIDQLFDSLQPLIILPSALERVERTVGEPIITRLQGLEQRLDGKIEKLAQNLETISTAQYPSLVTAVTVLKEAATEVTGDIEDAKETICRILEAIQTTQTTSRQKLEDQAKLLQRIQATLNGLGDQVAGHDRLITYYQEQLDTHSILTRLLDYVTKLSTLTAPQLDDITQMVLQELFGETAPRHGEMDLKLPEDLLTGVDPLLATLKITANISEDAALAVSQAQQRNAQLLAKLRDIKRAVVNERVEISYTVSAHWGEPERILKEIADSIRHEAQNLRNPQTYFNEQIKNFVRKEFITVIDACDRLPQSESLHGLLDSLIRHIGLQDTSPKPGTPFQGKDHYPVQYLDGTQGNVIERVVLRGFAYNGQEIRQPQVIVRR